MGHTVFLDFFNVFVEVRGSVPGPEAGLNGPGSLEESTAGHLTTKHLFPS